MRVLPPTLHALWDRALYRRTSLGHLLDRGDCCAAAATVDSAATPRLIVFEARAPSRALLTVEVRVDGKPSARARCEIAVAIGAARRRRAFEVSVTDGWRSLR